MPKIQPFSMSLIEMNGKSVDLVFACSDRRSVISMYNVFWCYAIAFLSVTIKSLWQQTSKAIKLILINFAKWWATPICMSAVVMERLLSVNKNFWYFVVVFFLHFSTNRNLYSWYSVCLDFICIPRTICHI